MRRHRSRPSMYKKGGREIPASFFAVTANAYLLLEIMYSMAFFNS